MGRTSRHVWWCTGAGESTGFWAGCSTRVSSPALWRPIGAALPCVRTPVTGSQPAPRAHAHEIVRQVHAVGGVQRWGPGGLQRRVACLIGSHQRWGGWACQPGPEENVLCGCTSCLAASLSVSTTDVSQPGRHAAGKWSGNDTRRGHRGQWCLALRGGGDHGDRR